MPILSFSNVDIKFAELEKLIWKFYIVVEALSMTSQIELISKREFAKVVQDTNLETFIIYMSALEAIKRQTIYSP